MNQIFRHVDLRQSVDPADVVDYLVLAGWQVSGRTDRYSVLRFRKIDVRAEVIVPFNRELDDYPDRILDVISAVERIELRDVAQILTDLQFAGSDIFRPHISTDDRQKGAIDARRAVTYIESLRDLMASAAHTWNSPRLICTGKPRPAVIKYMTDLRFGHSERGSYIVPVISPISPIQAPIKGDLDSLNGDLPFQRGVMLNVVRGIEIVRRAADSESVDQIKDAVADGVSINFCDAISKMLINVGSESINFEVTWSPRIRHDLGRKSFQSVEVRHSIFLNEASRLLRATLPRTEFRISGYVEMLEHKPGVKERKVYIHGLVDDKPARVAVSLEESDYNRAIDAHKSEQMVTCVGILRKEGGRYVLNDPIAFNVFNDRDDYNSNNTLDLT